uniref:Uncharacterized protein n=1 Tax=Plectus sambesii TaxID=2011161 RepID=A0A914W545_9BILA
MTSDCQYRLAVCHACSSFGDARACRSTPQTQQQASQLWRRREEERRNKVDHVYLLPASTQLLFDSDAACDDHLFAADLRVNNALHTPESLQSVAQLQACVDVPANAEGLSLLPREEDVSLSPHPSRDISSSSSPSSSRDESLPSLDCSTRLSSPLDSSTRHRQLARDDSLQSSPPFPSRSNSPSSWDDSLPLLDCLTRLSSPLDSSTRHCQLARDDSLQLSPPSSPQDSPPLDPPSRDDLPPFVFTSQDTSPSPPSSRDALLPSQPSRDASPSPPPSPSDRRPAMPPSDRSPSDRRPAMPPSGRSLSDRRPTTPPSDHALSLPSSRDMSSPPQPRDDSLPSLIDILTRHCQPLPDELLQSPLSPSRDNSSSLDSTSQNDLSPLNFLSGDIFSSPPLPRDDSSLPPLISAADRLLHVPLRDDSAGADRLLNATLLAARPPARRFFFVAAPAAGRPVFVAAPAAGRFFFVAAAAQDDPSTSPPLPRDVSSLLLPLLQNDSSSPLQTRDDSPMMPVQGWSAHLPSRFDQDRWPLRARREPSTLKFEEEEEGRCSKLPQRYQTLLHSADDDPAAIEMNKYDSASQHDPGPQDSAPLYDPEPQYDPAPHYVPEPHYDPAPQYDPDLQIDLAVPEPQPELFDAPATAEQANSPPSANKPNDRRKTLTNRRLPRLRPRHRRCVVLLAFDDRLKSSRPSDFICIAV